MLNLIRSLVIFFFAVFLLFFTPQSFASHISSPTGFVNDFANILTSGQKSVLENFLKDYEQKTGNEIAIAFVKSLEGGDIDDFTVRVFEEWKIGKKSQDNGILFLAAIEDRKMRIEVGYGLEPYLTDGKAGEIIRNVISPEFKKENYYEGVSKGIIAIQNNIAGIEEVPQKQANNLSFVIGIEFIFFGIFLVIYLIAFLARSKSFWAGGLIGGGLGIIWGNLLIGSMLMIIILVFLFGGIGLVFDWLLSRNYQKAMKAGKPTGFWGSWGGFKGGGGGFGGFGGGGSGGGGASGGW